MKKTPVLSLPQDASETVSRLIAYQDKTPLQFGVITYLQPQKKTDYNMKKITSSLTTQLKQAVVHLISITFKQILS